MSDRERRPETIAAHAFDSLDEKTGAVVPPLHTATTYARDADYALRDVAGYSRNGSPTVEHAERIIAALEGGADARVFAAGMAAIVAVFETVPQGGHVAAPHTMYHGTRDWLKRLEAKRRINLTFFDPGNAAALADAVQPGKTDILWIETPVNPTWQVIDIAHAADCAHKAGAQLAVDSTAATPVLSQPLRLGADIIFHSATKYLNGHSDVLAGALVTRENSPRWQEITALRGFMGSTLGSMEAWMLIRGMRTLHIRVRQACGNAMSVARHFEKHPALEAVLYPGLEGFSGHKIAACQMSGGFGGMMSILVKGSFEDAGEVIRRLKVFLPATSLGGVESLAEHRKVIEGPESPVPDNLIRLSIGIEAVEDLIEDLEQALAG